MIGNTIEFYFYNKHTNKIESKQGKVIDAYIEIKGNIKGKTEMFLGFGEGHTFGETTSERIYKIEYFESYDIENKFPNYTNIKESSLRKIIKYKE